MSKKTEWEKEFDGKFQVMFRCIFDRLREPRQPLNIDSEVYKEIKAFISDLLAKEKMELVERVIVWVEYNGIAEPNGNYSINLEAFKSELQEKEEEE